jgi:serine/threonine-protein kinase
MRRLDQPAAIELPGTEGAQRPFFSPDSQWIGFIARNSLYKVAVDGGAAVPLADVQVREAVWGEDDSILAMAGGIPTALWRIPASGGEPAKVLDPPEELLGHRLLQILPGGGHALVAGGMAATALGRFDREATIEALSLSDGSRTTVVRGATAAHYLPTGHLVYVSEGVLFAVAFDPYTLETRGAAVPILDDVQFNASSGATSLSFSREGTIVYRKGAGVAFSTFAAPRARIDWIDTAGRRSPLSARAGRFERLRFSPDGTRLAVLINDENGRDEWVLDLRRDNFSKITFGNLAITTPAWTRDGRYVIFGSGPPAPGIYWARADGDGEPQILVKTQGLNFVWSYSQDAGRLAYFALLGRGGGIFTVPIAEENGGLKAGTPAPFFESSSRVSTPEFSPDGRWIAYTTDETGRNEVQVRPFPAASGQGGKVSISTDGGENPRWSRTGNELLYQSGNRILSVRYTVTGDTFVPDRPRVRVDTLESADAWGWDLAPDGRIAVLTAVPVESEQALQLPPLEHTVMFLLNFFDELRRRVPVE